MNTNTLHDESQQEDGSVRFFCPHCGSHDMRKVTLIYEQATSNLNFRALSLNDFGSGAYTAGSGGMQNLMGGRIAPPASPMEPALPRFPIFSIVWLVFITFMLLRVAAGAAPGHMLEIPPHSSILEIVFSIFLVLGIPLLFLMRYVLRDVAYHRAMDQYTTRDFPEYQLKMARWNSAWICMRCGELSKYPDGI